MAAQRLLGVLLALTTVTSLVPAGALAANWQPDGGDWAVFRRSIDHQAATPNQGAFPGAGPGALGEIRVKWQRTDDPGYWVPPVAADLNNDGVAEIVATVGNASADPGSGTVNLESGVNVINGATGAVNWRFGPTTGDLVFFSPALGDIDGDGLGDIVWFQGNPLTGNALTNKVHAYGHAGTQKWTWSDTNWPAGKVPETLNGLTIGNVDGESARNEVVLLQLFATVVTTIQNQQVVITGSNPEYKVIALNGEGSPAISWQRSYTNVGSTSTPALADIDGDGVLDVLFGSGVKPGTVIDTASADIVLNGPWADDKIKVLRGSANPGEIVNFQATGFFPGDLASAPVAADLDQDGDPEILHNLWVRNVPPTAADTSQIVVVNRDGTEAWRHSFGGALFAPPAIADLNADGKLDVIAQTDNGGATDRYRVIALRHDGSEMWRAPSAGRLMTSAPAVGDITGDGKPEVLVTTAPSGGSWQLNAYNGQTGSLLWSRNSGGITSIGGPLLVDLDGDDDGRLEVLLHEGAWGSPGKMTALEPELPDLVVEGLGFSRTQHAYGEEETISVTVRNQGSRAATNALFELFDNGVLLASQSLTIPAGGSQPVQVAWTPGFLGARTILAIADRTKAVPEWAENNNQQSASVTVRAPDLAFDAGDPTFSDDSPVEGQTITVSATLRNLGGATARDVLVRFLDDGASFGEPVVASLAAGATTPVSAQLTVVGGEPHVIQVIADPDAAIVEENEANNAAGKTLVVVAPDLTFTAGDPVFSDTNPGEGDTITVSATLRNVGSADASDVLVRFLDEGVAFGEPVVASIPAGGTAPVSAPLTIAGEFVHAITVVADPEDALGEGDEDNNAFTRNLQVRFIAPDLTFSTGDPGFSDPLPSEGDTITVSVTLRNVGDKDATDVHVRFLDQGVPFAEPVVAALAEGGSAVVSAPLLVVGEVVHTVQVVADPAGAINELAEDNNAVSGSFQVRIPDLSITSISFDDPNPDDTGTLVATVHLLNDGGSTGRVARDVRVDLFDDGGMVGTAVVPQVPDGGTADAVIAYIVSGVGPHAVTVTVDPLDSIHEQGEANNDAAASIVVGKIVPLVTMDKDAFALDEAATGVVELTFRRTGAPVPDHEFPLVIEYIVRGLPGTGQAEDVLNLAAVLVAQLAAETDQHLQVCSLDRCIDLDLGGSESAAQLLGLASQAGSGGAELRLRLFTLDLRTDRNGEASFAVPFSVLGAFDPLRVQTGLSLCLTGFDDVWAALEQPDPGCVENPVTAPTAPSAGNLPGQHRATAVADWFGHLFRGSADYTHAP